MHLSATFHIFAMFENKRYRTVVFYKHYFSDFFDQQSRKVREKIVWSLDLIEEHERIPNIYLKKLEGIPGLYEIKVRHGVYQVRVFCFFRNDHLVVLTNGFYKNSQKTPKEEIERALKIKHEYEIEQSK